MKLKIDLSRGLLGARGRYFILFLEGGTVYTWETEGIADLKVLYSDVSYVVSSLNLKLECTLGNLFFLIAGYFQESTSLEVSFVSFCLFIYTRNDVWAISSLLLQGL